MGAEILSKLARKELVGVIRKKYHQASKDEKSSILNELTQLSGYHRKHVIRLMGKLMPDKSPTVIRSNKIYDEAVRDVLIVLWETADRICGKRLKAIIPDLVKAMERHGHLNLESAIREKVLSTSASTIDRIFRPIRKSTGHRKKKKRVFRKLSKEIPTKTSHDWQNSEPGYVEIDFVVHGGGSMSGEYLHSLVATDVCSGWTEAVSLLAREQSLTVEGLKRIQIQMPIDILGINSDNDTAFITDTLKLYCEQRNIVFTHSRVHHSNDQAWIEQKNGAVIRKIVGHERFSGIIAGQAMAQLFQIVRLYVNYFQPSFKLLYKIRDGAKVKKWYDSPATPCDRLLADKRVSEKIKESLRMQKEQLDPVELLQRMRQGQAALAALSAGTSNIGSNRQSLDQFLSQLPRLWQDGEVRPTHRKSEIPIRYWRTREDPFKNVWTDILLWLQDSPDSTAKSLFQRLKEKYPDQFSDGQLRTLQRRVGEWRHTMARKLIFNRIDDINDIAVVGNNSNLPQICDQNSIS
ncbi:MAG: transposase family protein [Candidatus Omnitrophica bacterium]|nr:transposase family protein [Candidatus Omnitrophota bacterium]